MTRVSEELMSEFLKGLKVKGTATVLHKPGAVRLDDYPLLVYSPRQWGEGVRTEDNGTPVADIATAFAANPDPEAVAKQFKTTPKHVADALRYAVQAGFATT